MALRCQPVETTTTTLTSSTVSMSETTWTYALAAVLNSIYFDPDTRRLYKALVSGVAVGTHSFSALNNTVNKTAHSYTNGKIFTFSGGTAPTGLSPSTPYHIVNAATDTFQLALTADGEPIDFTTDGSGTTAYVNAPFDDSASWQDRGPPNKWAMFDESNQSVTTFSSSLTVVIAPSSRIDSIAALAMSGVSHLYVAMTGTGESHSNGFPRSQEFNDASWTKNSGASVTANTARGADGTTTADTIDFGADALSSVSRTGAAGSGERTVSVWAKGDGETFRFIAHNGTDGYIYGPDIELTGTLTRYSHTFTIAASSTFHIANGSDGAARSIVAWGAQLEIGSEMTSYIPTTSGTSTTTTNSYYREIVLTDTSFSDDWYADTYSETVYLRDVAVSDIEPLASQSITVTLIAPGDASVGSLVLALSKNIGKAWYSSRVSTRNFTEGMDPDEFANVNPVIRGFAKRGNFTVGHPEDKSDAIKALYEEKRATPGLWLMAPAPAGSGLQWRQRGILYGLGRNWDFEFWKPEDNKHELEIEGYA